MVLGALLPLTHPPMSEQEWQTLEACQTAQTDFRSHPRRLLHGRIVSSPSLVTRGYKSGEGLDFLLFLLLNILTLVSPINHLPILMGNTLAALGTNGEEQGLFTNKPL